MKVLLVFATGNRREELVLILKLIAYNLIKNFVANLMTDANFVVHFGNCCSRVPAWNLSNFTLFNIGFTCRRVPEKNTSSNPICGDTDICLTLKKLKYLI